MHIEPNLFADDITVLAAGTSAANYTATTRQATDLIMARCDANGMPLTPAKTKALLRSHPHNSDETNDGLQVGAVHIPVPVTRSFDPDASCWVCTSIPNGASPHTCSPTPTPAPPRRNPNGTLHSYPPHVW